MKKNKTFVFDLDGTLCEEKPTFERSLARPIQEMINLVNKLARTNNIIIYTARGWAEFEMTRKWLEDNEVSYNTLLCGKPIYDVWVDDRCISPEKALKNYG